MDPRPASRRLDDPGVSSVQFVLAAALALILFLALANVVVFQYGRGAVRAALEQGARAGSTGGVAACEATADQVVDDLLGGRMSDGMVLGCSVSGGLMVASASVTFESWTPLMPDYTFSLTSQAVIEQ